jgi:hypothetical protein
MASGKATNLSAGLLAYIFQAVLTGGSSVLNTSSYVLAGAAGAASNLYVSLHTADPSGANVQNTSEAAYTGYQRVAVVRSASGWTLASQTVSNAAIVAFAACTGGSETESYFGIGLEPTGNAGVLLYSAALTSPLAVSNGITPSFAIGQLTITES